MTRIRWLILTLTVILEAVGTQGGVPPPIFEEPVASMLGGPLDDLLLLDSGESPNTTTEMPQAETITSNLTVTQLPTTEINFTKENGTQTVTVSSVTEASTPSQSNETDSQNATASDSATDSTVEMTTLIDSPRDQTTSISNKTVTTTDSNATQTSVGTVTSPENIINESVVAQPDPVTTENKIAAVIPIESIPGVADLETGATVAANVSETVTEQELNEISKTNNETVSNQTAESTGANIKSDFNKTELSSQDRNTSRMNLSGIEDKSVNISVLDPLGSSPSSTQISSTSVKITTIETETVPTAENVSSTDIVTAPDVTVENITSGRTNDNTTTAGIIPTQKLSGFETGENVSLTVNDTVESATEPLVTTAESINITSKREKGPSIAIDPSIAIGINPLIFEDATPFAKDNQTISVQATATSVAPIETTTLAFNTTVYQETSTLVVEDKQKELPTETVAIPSQPPVPDHPPPIMFAPSLRRKQGVQTFGGFKPVIEKPSIPVLTTPPPPPPIIIPKRPVRKYIKPKLPFYRDIKTPTSTATPFFPFKKPARTIQKTPPASDPRYMSVSELAELALQHLNLAQRPSKKTGLQVFFQPTASLTTKHKTTTTQIVSPITTPAQRRTTNFVYNVRTPLGNSLTNSIPWLHAERTGVQPKVPSRPSNQLFTKPKKSKSLNVWGGSKFWEQTQLTTTTERPGIHVRPLQPPPTVNMLSKTGPFGARRTLPSQPAPSKFFHSFNPPSYNVLGSQKSTKPRGVEPLIKPLVRSESLFDLPGLHNLIPENQISRPSQPEIRSLWPKKEKSTLADLSSDTLRMDTVKLPSKPTNKAETTLFQPTKNLRRSQHDIRSFKTQPYHYFKPSMNIVLDNELDLFLRSNLARYGGKNRQQPENSFTKRKSNKRIIPNTTTLKPAPSKASNYKRTDNSAPLSFQELLLRQLQGDASIFDMSRAKKKIRLPKKPTKKPDPLFNINIDLHSSNSSVIIQPLDRLQTATTTATIPTVTSLRPTWRTTQSTPEPVAAEHPPPIFDSKVFKTFMPFPKDEPTTEPPAKGKTKDLMGTGDIKPFDETAGIDHGTCKGCTFINDRCLLPDPIHCNRYIECVKQTPAVRVFIRECALGSFFDRKSFLCVDPKSADCPTDSLYLDRCRETGLKSYIIHGHCKHYWVCGSRKGGGIFAQAECCPEGGGFKEGEGCIENPNCTESCDFSKIEEKITGPTCECSQGIPILKGDTCTCREPTAMEKLKSGATTCSPILNMTFDGGKIEDTSSTRQHVSTEHIAASDGGELIMTGKGRIILWRYSNLAFSDVFAIQIRFKSTTAGPRYQTLLSNCDPKSGNEPSLDISIDTKYHEVIFSVNTYKGPTKQIKIYYQTNQWTTVYLIYDGERIVAAVDGRVRNIFAGGRIEARPNPIGVGSCGAKTGLKGLIDDVAFFEDCITDDMYDIFVNVLE